LEPENTLRSVNRAIDIGVDAVEVDVRKSKDGKLVIVHDPSVDRTTNGKGAVATLTLKELKALDAGKGERIPTLDEMMGAVRGKVGLFLEIKEPETTSELVSSVKAAGLESATTFVSFFHPALLRVRLLSPSLRCGAIFSCEPADPTRLAVDARVELMLPKVDYVSELMVREAHRHSMLVQPWVINDPSEATRVTRMGVDGVASDFPNRVIESLR